MPVAAPLTKRPLSVACTFNYLFRSMHLLLHILRNRSNKVKSKKLLMSSQFIIKMFLGISTIHYRKKHMIITVKKVFSSGQTIIMTNAAFWLWLYNYRYFVYIYCSNNRKNCFILGLRYKDKINSRMIIKSYKNKQKACYR